MPKKAAAPPKKNQTLGFVIEPLIKKAKVKLGFYESLTPKKSAIWKSPAPKKVKPTKKVGRLGLVDYEVLPTKSPKKLPQKKPANKNAAPKRRARR